MYVTNSFRTIVMSFAVALATPFVASAGEVVAAFSRFVVSPGQEAEFEARLLRTAEFLRKAAPDMTFHAHRSKKDPQVFVVYESWPSLAANEHYRTVVRPARVKEFGPMPTGMLVKPPEAEFFSRLTD